MLPLTNAQKRQAAAEEVRDRKIDVIFRARHATGKDQHHVRWVRRDAVGQWHRVECTSCDVVINFTDADLATVDA